MSGTPEPPSIRAQVEIAVATGQPLTLGDLRGFLDRCDRAGIPDSAVPVVRTTWSARLRRLSVKGASGGAE